MATFASYATPAIGRAPTQGTLTAKMTYSIRSGIMEGSNELTLQDMKLGAQDESPGAPKLPLDLAIAILEDTHGTIEIDLPVKGDLSHPKFSFDRVITHAIANVVNKVATAPFRMLGNLLPDGQDFDEDFIAFEPGESQLNGKGSKMVEAIAKVMEARPRIRVELRGSYSTKQDGKALAEQRFQNQLAELTDKGKSRKDAIKSLYKDLSKDQKESGWLLPEPEVMEADVRKAIKISKEDIKALADQRVKVVLTALKKAKIDEDRIALKRPETADSPRIELNFDVRS
jgi:outer membrane protein OmpA-like peptidoglycan-associated protein